MIPISAASIAPRNEVSSQGCTTIVVAGFTSFARAMRCSYFDAIVPNSPFDLTPVTSAGVRVHF